MRKLFITLIISMISISYFGCYASKEITEAEQVKIYEHTIDLTKQELKNKLISYISETFNSGKAIIQINDDGIFSGSYFEYMGSIDPFGSPDVYAEYTFIIKYSDNMVKAKLILKNMETRGGGMIGNFSSSYWGTFEKESRSCMQKFDEQLVKYITDKSGF